VFVSLPSSRFADRTNDIAWAAAVVMVGHSVVATATATRQLVRPYQPGYLALTMGPILEDVVHALSQRPDIILVNAAGRDHIRGAGLAIQLGSALSLPTVGVTERPDVGIAPEPGAHRGDWTPVRADGRLVGFRVRTLARAKPVMAHSAWLTTPETARDIVIRSTGRMRVPEPLQQARQLSRRLRSEYESTGTGMQDGIHG
jgi:deoxyribonuclease V